MARTQREIILNQFSLNNQLVEIFVPPSKSIMHRMVIGTGLAGGDIAIRNYYGEDIEATVCCMQQLMGKDLLGSKNKSFCCKDSGTTLRLLLPILAMDAWNTRVTGSEQLAVRPLKPLCDALAAHGIAFEFLDQEDRIPLSMTGKLTSGKYYLPGNVSSQFVSGLLFALPLLDGDSEIILTSPLQSEPYVKMTVAVLNRFGIDIEAHAQGYGISGNQSFYPFSENIVEEGDYSHSAYWMVLGLILPEDHPGVVIRSLLQNTIQGDGVVVRLLTEMGGRILPVSDGFHVKPSPLKGIEMDLKDYPDLLPPLSVAAMAAKGKTVFSGLSHLKYKESDRLVSVAEMITALGGKVSIIHDRMIVEGGYRLSGGKIDTKGDHRIAMAAAISRVLTDRSVVLNDGLCVNKSYPEFFQHFRQFMN